MVRSDMTMLNKMLVNWRGEKRGDNEDRKRGRRRGL